MAARVRSLALALVAGGLLAGCVPELAATDGDLLDQWTGFPEPEVFVPEAGTCHTTYQPSVRLGMYQPIGCDVTHTTETVHVGEFVGEAADRTAPPTEGTGVWRAAYRECDTAATEYLGGNFRSVRGLWLGVTVPSAAAWDGGARWFRCEILIQVHPDWTVELRRSSLAGVVTDDFPLRYGCSRVEELEDDLNLLPVDCDDPHQAEFVGLWEPPGHLSYPDSDDDRVFEGCYEVVADFLGVRLSDLYGLVGTVVTWPSEEDWDNGDRVFRCHVYSSEEDLTESLAGVGAAGLREALG